MNYTTIITLSLFILFALLSHLGKDVAFSPIHTFKARGRSSSPIGGIYSSRTSTRLKELHSTDSQPIDLSFITGSSFDYPSRIRERIIPESIEVPENEETRLPYYSFKFGMGRLRRSSPKNVFSLNTAQYTSPFFRRPLPLSESIDFRTVPSPIRPTHVSLNSVPKEKSSRCSKKIKRPMNPAMQTAEVLTEPRWQYITPRITPASQPLQATRVPVLASQQAQLSSFTVPASSIASVTTLSIKDNSINKKTPAQKGGLTSVAPKRNSTVQSRKAPDQIKQPPKIAPPVKNAALISGDSQTIPAKGTTGTPKLKKQPPKAVLPVKNAALISGDSQTIPANGATGTPKQKKQAPKIPPPVKNAALVSGDSQTIPANGATGTPKIALPVQKSGPPKTALALENMVNPEPIQQPTHNDSSSENVALTSVESKPETSAYEDLPVVKPTVVVITEFNPVPSTTIIEEKKSYKALIWVDNRLLSCMHAFILNFMLPHIKEIMEELKRKRWALTKNIESQKEELSHALEPLEVQLRNFKRTRKSKEKQINHKEHVINQIQQWLKDKAFRQEDILDSITGLLERTTREFETKENTFKELVTELEKLYERETGELLNLIDQATKLDNSAKNAKLGLKETEEILIAIKEKASALRSEYESFEQNIVTEVRDKIVFWISQINNFKPQTFKGSELVTQSPKSLLERFCDQLEKLKFKLTPDKLQTLCSSQTEELYTYVQTYFRKRLKSEGGYAILQDLFKRLEIEDSSNASITASYIFDTWIPKLKKVQLAQNSKEKQLEDMKKEYEELKVAAEERHKIVKHQMEELGKLEENINKRKSEIPDLGKSKKDISDLKAKCKKVDRESLVSSQEIRHAPTLPTSPTKLKLNERANEHSELQTEALNQEEKLRVAEACKAQLEKEVEEIKDSIQSKKREIEHTDELYKEKIRGLENETKKVVELGKNFRAYGSMLDKLDVTILSLFDKSKEPMTHDNVQAYNQTVIELENSFSTEGELSDLSIIYAQWKEKFFNPEHSYKKAKNKAHRNIGGTTQSHIEDLRLFGSD